MRYKPNGLFLLHRGSDPQLPHFKAETKFEGPSTTQFERTRFFSFLFANSFLSFQGGESRVERWPFACVLLSLRLEPVTGLSDWRAFSQINYTNFGKLLQKNFHCKTLVRKKYIIFYFLPRKNLTNQTTAVKNCRLYVAFS